MSACLIICSCLFFISGKGREDLVSTGGMLAGGEWPELFQEILLFIFLFILCVVGRLVYRRVKKINMVARMASGNHPAIPAPVYEDLQIPKPPKLKKEGKGKAPKKQIPPTPASTPPGEEELPDAYTFYSQLDQLEED